jgi:hypothetical protein
VNINPIVINPKDALSNVFYLFDSITLVNLTTHINYVVSLADGKKIHIISRSLVFPYLFKGKACFAFVSESFEALPTNDVCPARVRKPVPLDFTRPHEVLKHMGAHILFDPQYHQVSEPCGLCLTPSPNVSFRDYEGKRFRLRYVN